MTFVESAVGLARCVKQGKTTMEAFRAELQKLRYRDGIIDGYPSRLHYFTDWVKDNARKGLVEELTSSLGGVPRRSPIDFMSTHREAYRQLREDKVLEKVREDLDLLPPSAR